MQVSRICPFLTGIAIALATPSIAREEPAQAPPNNSTQIISVAFAGSGCPAGSISGALLPDPSKLTLNYTTFIAESGKGVPAAKLRKNCQLNFKIKYPSGWQFTIAKTNYRGYANIPVEVTGIARSTYYFSGDGKQMVSSMSIKGPYEGDFLKTDQIGVASSIWSPCGAEGLMNINSEVRLDPRNSTETAVLSLTSLEKVELQWHRCAMGKSPSNSSTSSQPAPSSPPTQVPGS